MEVILQFLFMSFVQFAVGTDIQNLTLDASTVCSPQPELKCGSQSSSVHRWENVQLDCYTDTLRVNYTNYMYHGLEDLQYYRIREVRLECTNHEGETPHITCSNTNFEKAEADQDVFTFTNLSGAEIHPGATCTVYGCYRIEIDAVVDVLAPIKNCTIKGMSSAATPSTMPTPVLTTVSITKSVSTSPILNSIISMESPFPQKDNNAAVMDSNIELYTGIGVVLVLLVAVMLTIAAIFALRCKQQKKSARIRNVLKVLDDKNMVFNPKHPPPVSIDKISFNHRKISLVSVDLIQSLIPDKLLMSFESSGKAITTNEPDDLPRYVTTVQNSIRESDDMQIDDSKDDVPGSSTHNFNVPEQSVGLPADDHLSDCTQDVELYQSITCDSLNAQTTSLTQDDDGNTTEYSDALQPQLTSVKINYQTTSSNSMTADNNTNLDRQEFSTASYFHPPNFNQIPTFPNLNIQLDQEYNEESLYQSPPYIVPTLDQNHQGQQTSFASTTENPTIMFDGFEDDMDDLGANDMNGSFDNGQFPLINSTDSLNMIDECNGEILNLNVAGYDQSPPTSNQGDNEFDTIAENLPALYVIAFQGNENDLDRGSLVPLDCTREVHEPQISLENRNQNMTLNDSGYLQY